MGGLVTFLNPSDSFINAFVFIDKKIDDLVDKIDDIGTNILGDSLKYIENTINQFDLGTMMDHDLLQINVYNATSNSLSDDINSLSDKIISCLNTLKDELKSSISDASADILTLFQNVDISIPNAAITNSQEDTANESQTDSGNPIYDFSYNLLKTVRDNLFGDILSALFAKLLKNSLESTASKTFSTVATEGATAGTTMTAESIVESTAAGAEIASVEEAGATVASGAGLSAIGTVVLPAVAITGLLTVLYAKMLDNIYANPDKYNKDTFNNSVADYFNKETPYQELNPGAGKINPLSQILIDYFSIKSPYDSLQPKNDTDNLSNENASQNWLMESYTNKGDILGNIPYDKKIFKPFDKDDRFSNEDIMTKNDNNISPWLTELFKNDQLTQRLLSENPMGAPYSEQTENTEVVSMNEDDINNLNSMAESKTSTVVNNTLTPYITISFGDVNQTADVNEIISRLNIMLRKEIALAPEGVYHE